LDALDGVGLFGHVYQCTMVPQKAAWAGREFPQAAILAQATTGSFDCVAVLLHKTATSLRMTVLI
jgi:hypothetical protein